MDKINQLAQALSDDVIALRRSFHKYPELGWCEYRTASIITEELIQLGYEVTVGKPNFKAEARMGLPSETEMDKAYAWALENGGHEQHMKAMKGGFTGVTASLKIGKGPNVAFRFDIDALRINESSAQSHLPAANGFVSDIKGQMHACGHDAHAAIGLGVARIITDLKSDLEGLGTIKLIFQPSEEGVRGAKAMVEAGVLDDVDYVAAAHIMANEPSGLMICSAKGFMATNKIDAVFKGAPSHAGAAPSDGKNAMLAACTAVMNIHAIPRHKHGASRVNVGQLVAGTDRNIITEEARLKIETRGQNTEINSFIYGYVMRILEGAAQMHDVELEVANVGASIGGNPTEAFVNRIEHIGETLECFTRIEHESTKPAGSEDFAYMMECVQENGGQAVYFMIGSKGAHGHHTAAFDIDESDMINAVKMFAGILIDIAGRN